MVLRRLAPFHADAVEGRLNHWKDHPDSALALCLLFDQVPRNIFRGATVTLLNIEVVVGGTGNDVIYGLNTSSLSDTLNGGGGNDTIYGGNAHDSFVGAAGGHEYVSYANPSVTLTAGLIIDLTNSGHGTGIAAGDNFGSNLYEVLGTAYSDTFIGGTPSGSASMAGNGGSDWINYRYVTAAGTVNLASTNSGSAANDHMSGIENIMLGTANLNSFVVIGDSNSNSILGDNANDTFFGSLGNDTYIGYHGASNLNTLSYSTTVSSALTVNIANYLSGTAIYGGKTDFLVNIENVIGGSANDYISAAGDTVLMHTLTGGAGNDTIIGGYLSDTLNGEAGNNTLDGGGGAYNATTNFKTVNYSFEATGLTVELANDLSGTPGHAYIVGSTDTIYNIEGVLGGSRIP